MTEYDHQQWMKYMRRHEANVFNTIFYDKEEVTEDDIQHIITDVATFFNLPKPEINSKCESFAEVLMSNKAGECELSYNLDMLKKWVSTTRMPSRCASCMKWRTRLYIDTSLYSFVVRDGCRN